MKKQILAERLEFYVTLEGSQEHTPNKLLLAASAAASVGAILVPPPADAAIVYSGVQNKVVSTQQVQQQVDLNDDGTFEFTFRLSTSAPFTYSQQLAVAGTASVIKDSVNAKPTRLISNYMISSQKSFFSVNSDDLAVFASSVPSGGNFLGEQGYLGVKFKIADDTHYGWIQYKAENNASVGTIIDWAYEDIPGKRIKAGAIKKFNWNLFLPAIIAGNKNK